MKQVEKDKQVQLLMQQIERIQDKYVEAAAEIRASAETVAEHIQQFIAHRRLPCEASDSIAAALAELKAKKLFTSLSSERSIEDWLQGTSSPPEMQEEEEVSPEHTVSAKFAGGVGLEGFASTSTKPCKIKGWCRSGHSVLREQLNSL